MENTVHIPVTIRSDKKGYYDRKCPNENCSFVFKVLMSDWESTVSKDKVHCPLCGNEEESDKWYTDEQSEALLSRAKDYAFNLVQTEFGRMLKGLESSSSKYIRIRVSTPPSIPLSSSPILQREEWEVEIQCEKCGVHYSVIGSAYFCPHCGYSSIISVFDKHLDSVEKRLLSNEGIKEKLEEVYNKDDAEIMHQKMIENLLTELVSTFQKLASYIIFQITGKDIKGNNFQNIDKGNWVLFELLGRKYEDWISDSELTKMKLHFQRRHLLEHNLGFIDKEYIQ